MAIPDKIPIARLEDLYTNYLGKCAGNRLFWGLEIFAFTVPAEKRTGKDWEKHRKEYIVLFLFNSDGDFLEARHIYASLTSETGGSDFEEEIKSLMADLSEVSYEDIAVKPFKTIIDGFTFGLIVDEENEAVHLQPSSLITFLEPWDGEYYI